MPPRKRRTSKDTAATALDGDGRPLAPREKRDEMEEERDAFRAEFDAVAEILQGVPCGDDGAIGPVLYPAVRYIEARLGEIENVPGIDDAARRNVRPPELEAFEAAATAFRETGDLWAVWKAAMRYRRDARTGRRGRVPERGRTMAGIQLAVAAALVRRGIKPKAAESVTALAWTAAAASVRGLLGKDPLIHPSIHHLPNSNKELLPNGKEPREQGLTGWRLLAEVRNALCHFTGDFGRTFDCGLAVWSAFERALRERQEPSPDIGHALEMLADTFEVVSRLAHDESYDGDLPHGALPLEEIRKVAIRGKQVADARTRYKDLLPP